MSKIEFKPWPKIGRENPLTVTITEKIDGTNACIIIQDGEIVGVQSRKRFITPEDDNYGFAGWVEENKEALKSLGDGYHYGEWAGLGIQKNPLELEKKEFFLFNTFRWNVNNPNLPECCKAVPVLFEGILGPSTVELIMNMLQNSPKNHEGIVIYQHSSKTYIKQTFKYNQGKWRGAA